MNFALTTLAAFSLGAMHALEPGHGKTFITSYLFTGKSSRKHLMIMGFSMAFSHTVVLLMLGLLMMVFSAQIAEAVSEVILIGSPLLVIGIGAFMLFKSYKKKAHAGCSCGTHHHHEPQHTTAAKPQLFGAKPGKISVAQQPQKINSRTAAFVGFTGGLLPCPSALAVFSLSGATGSAKSTVCMLLLYVVGFIVVMGILIIGASMLKNRVVSKYFTESKNLLVQKISAYAILITGFAYLIHNVVEHM